jgi:uncharacterized protein (TIGR02453 family)
MAETKLKETLDFLSDLSFNNNRPWFEEHRQQYETSRKSFESLVDGLIQRLSAHSDLSGVTPKNSIMRIYRDVRFSKDKTPYNPWMAAHIAPGGKKSGRLGFGIRLSPGESGAAGGLWDPTPEQLAGFRRSVDADPDVFFRIVEAPDFLRLFGRVRGEALKTTPKGFAKDHRAAEFLKMKQIYAMESFDDEVVSGDDFEDRLITAFVVLKPFLDYLNGVIP